MDSIPDCCTVGRCMTVVTILAPGCTVVVGQHCVMRIVCQMACMIKVSSDHRMTINTGGRTASIVKGAALQGSVLTARRSHICMTVFTANAPGVNNGDNISCAVTVGTLRRTGGYKVRMTSAGGMGTFKVSNIRRMTIHACACLADGMALSSTIGSRSANTVAAGTIAETAVRATSHLRIDMTVLTVSVCCTGCIMDICYYIRTSIVTCRRTVGRSGKICGMCIACQMAGISKVVVQGRMTGQTGGIVTRDKVRGAAGKRAISAGNDMTESTLTSVDAGLDISRAMTIRTLGSAGSQQSRTMGISRMDRVVGAVISTRLAVTIRTTAGHTLTVIGGNSKYSGSRRAANTRTVSKRSVCCADMTGLAGCMDNCLDNAAMTVRRTVACTGQHG